MVKKSLVKNCVLRTGRQFVDVKDHLVI